MKLPPTIRSIYDFSLHTGFQKTRSNTVVPTGIDSNPEEGQPSTSREESVPAEDEMENNKMTVGDPEILPYVFYPDRLPPARQVIYQLCDIRCAEAQELISANDGKVWSLFRFTSVLKPSTTEKPCNLNIFRALKLDKNSPPITVDLIAQQVERRTGILKVPVQIPLESTFFSWAQQCQIIMKNF